VVDLGDKVGDKVEVISILNLRKLKKKRRQCGRHVGFWFVDNILSLHKKNPIPLGVSGLFACTWHRTIAIANIFYFKCKYYTIQVEGIVHTSPI